MANIKAFNLEGKIFEYINWWWRKIYIFRSVAHNAQNIYVEIQKITEDFKLMPLSYLKQEIVAKEKSYGQENLKAKKFETREMQLNSQSLLYTVTFKKVSCR